MRLHCGKAFIFTGLALGVLAVSGGGASAQSGSRLCGWVAVGTPVKIGLLYEARKKDASYKKQCSEVIKKMESQIKNNDDLKKMAWTKVDKKSCEDVGKMGFANAGESNDICDKMEAKKPYKVVKSGPKASATYTKL